MNKKCQACGAIPGDGWTLGIELHEPGSLNCLAKQLDTQAQELTTANECIAENIRTHIAQVQELDRLRRAIGAMAERMFWLEDAAAWMEQHGLTGEEKLNGLAKARRRGVLAKLAAIPKSLNAAEIDTVHRIELAEGMRATAVRYIQAVHDLPVEHDEHGHAFKRVKCRSLMDLGAIIGQFLANPYHGQPLTDELDRLRRVIEALGNHSLFVVQEFGGPEWSWTTDEPAAICRRYFDGYPTALDAALAGVEELEKEAGK